MNRRNQVVLGLSMASCLLAGCATTDSLNAVRQDQDESKTRIHALERDLKGVKDQTGGLKEELQGFRKADADLQANIESVKSEMRSVTGKVEDQGVASKKPAEEIGKLREDTEKRILALDERLQKMQLALDDANKKIKELSSQPAPQTAAKELPQSADTLYLKGMTLYQGGDMPGARGQFTQFLERNPSHELAPNARYWLGETYYSEKNYEQAILEFQEVVKQFPQRDKAPAALLKQALSFKELNDIKSTQYLLKNLVSSYPKSEEAKKAQQLLKTIK